MRFSKNFLKKLFYISFPALTLCLVLGGFIFVQDSEASQLVFRKLEVDYPRIPGVITPTTIKTPLPEYVKYIFNFTIIISGLIAFGSLIYGGVRWLTSAGSPTALKDAQGQIFASFLGLIVLFSSYLILTTINPQLIFLTRPEIEINWGIVLITEDGSKYAFTKDISDLSYYLEKKEVKKIRFEGDHSLFCVDLYSNTNYTGEKKDYCFYKEEEREQDTSFSPESLRFAWKLPGVYLIDKDGKEKYLPASTASLGDFNKKVVGIRFNNTATMKYGAVLHTWHDFKGECAIFLETELDLLNNSPFAGVQIMDTRTQERMISSVTVFNYLTEKDSPIGAGVTFYKYEDHFKPPEWGPFSGTGEKGTNPLKVKDVTETKEGMESKKTRSLRIDGYYMAVLFESVDFKNTCQVFFSSDSDLADDPIGRCGCIIFGWGCRPCLSSFVIIPIK